VTSTGPPPHRDRRNRVPDVAIRQIFATGRTGITGHRDQEYRKPVDELSGVQRDTASGLQKTNEALAQLRA